MQRCLQWSPSCLCEMILSRAKYDKGKHLKGTGFHRVLPDFYSHYIHTIMYVAMLAVHSAAEGLWFKGEDSKTYNRLETCPVNFSLLLPLGQTFRQSASPAHLNLTRGVARWLDDSWPPNPDLIFTKFMTHSPNPRTDNPCSSPLVLGTFFFSDPCIWASCGSRWRNQYLWHNTSAEGRTKSFILTD